MKQTIFYIISILIFASCNDMHDKPRSNLLPDTGNDFRRLFVLAEGLWGRNDSELILIDFDAGTFRYNFFSANNNRGLGDTANDMKLFGSQLWIVTTGSSQVEVLDVNTGRSIRQIPMFDERNRARHPRNIVFYNNQAFVSAFDGTVSRINVQTFEIAETIEVGRDPDGMAVANSKLYVSNSGGRGFQSGLEFDNTVSVICLERFEEIKKIEVGVNPHHIHADSRGYLFLVSRGNGNTQPKFQQICSIEDRVVRSFDLPVVNFTIRNDIAYMYSFDFETNDFWVKTFDCINGTVISEQFITDGTTLRRPFGIFAHPTNGSIFISDAINHTWNGHIFCFDRYGQLRYKIEDIGLNPSVFVFVDR